MRSERDIQRKPRRPTRSDSPDTPATPDAGTGAPTPATAPVVVNADVKVSFAPPSGDGRGADRRPAGRGERWEAPGSDRRGPAREVRRDDRRPDPRSDHRREERRDERRDEHRGDRLAPRHDRGPDRRMDSRMDSRMDRRPDRPGDRPGGRPGGRPDERRPPEARAGRPAPADRQRPVEPRGGRGPWRDADRDAGRGRLRDDAGRDPWRDGRPHAERHGERHAGRPPERPSERQPFVRSGADTARPRAAGEPMGHRPPSPPTPRQAPADAGDRLAKVIADRGLASRREADDWIAAGWVRVDGRLAELGQRVGPDAHIEIDPAARQEQAQRVTILLHKPIGYVSGQAEDGYEPASVLVRPDTRWAEDPLRKPFHPGHARGLAPAGRLDIDSTGLLVLTQDGRIAKALIGEDSTIEKEYLVRVQAMDGSPPQLSAEGLARLNHGLALDGVQLKPAKVSWANEDQLRFVLREGRKRQVRRMCELVGLKVVGLKRVRIGSVVLGKLPPGEWRYLRDDERF